MEGTEVTEAVGVVEMFVNAVRFQNLHTGGQHITCRICEALVAGENLLAASQK